MAWTYLAESEGSQKPWKDTSDRLPTVKTTDTLKPFSCLECGLANFPEPPSGTTCERCQKANSQLFPILFTAASHAKTLALPALQRVWEESEADYFSRSSGSLAKYDPPSSSWRTCPQSVQGGGATVVAELARLGYDCRWITLPATTVGGGHARLRWWLLAYSQDHRRQYALNGSSESVTGQRQKETLSVTRIPPFDKERFHEQIRATEFVRTANGIPNRVDRVYALGNAVYPDQAQEAFERLGGLCAA